MPRNLSQGSDFAAPTASSVIRAPAVGLVLALASLVGSTCPTGRLQAATFAMLGGNLTIRAGGKPQQFTPAAIGSAGLSDTDLIGSIDLAAAGLQTARVGGAQFIFSATASSVTNAAAPPDSANATAAVTFVQNFTTIKPQWLELRARVTSPPADPNIYAFLTVARAGQHAPIFALGDTGGASLSQAGLFSAGSYTLQGSITTSATTAGTHAGVIDGSIVIAELADFNSNALVDSGDLATVINGFGSMTGALANGNLDGDGDTDGDDFLIAQRQLGISTLAAPAVAPAPEPASGALAGSALLAAAAYCRTRRSAARRASASPAR